MCSDTGCHPASAVHCTTRLHQSHQLDPYSQSSPTAEHEVPADGGVAGQTTWWTGAPASQAKGSHRGVASDPVVASVVALASGCALNPARGDEQLLDKRASVKAAKRTTFKHPTWLSLGQPEG